jgi:hypothetical protein
MEKAQGEHDQMMIRRLRRLVGPKEKGDDKEEQPPKNDERKPRLVLTRSTR